MINWEKLKRAARLRIMEATTEAEEERIGRLIKYIKFRIDRNIYTIEENVVLWDSSRRTEKETVLNLHIKPAANFKEYCETQRRTIKESFVF